jgi:hypothetical protein
MSNSKKYWYFRLKPADIRSHKIQQIKQVPILGYTIFTIYIELCALAVEEDEGGVIVIDQTSSERSYIGELSALIGENEKDTSEAVSYLRAKDLVEVWADGNRTSIKVPLVINNIGKSSSDADRKRAALAKNEEQYLLPKELKRKKYGTNQNVWLDEEELKELKEQCRDVEKVIDIVSIKKFYKQTFNGLDFDYCLKVIKEDKSLQKVQKG